MLSFCGFFFKRSNLKRKDICFEVVKISQINRIKVIRRKQPFMLIKKRCEKFTLFITYPWFCFNLLPSLLKKFRYTSVSKGNNWRSLFIKKLLSTTMKLIPLITFIKHFWSTYLSLCFHFLKTNSYSEKTVNGIASKEESDPHFSLHRKENKAP